MTYACLHPGERLLDVGIGTGLASEPFASAGVAVFGLDSDAEMLALCRAKGFAADLVQHDLTITPWPYGEASFDHVLAAGVLHFFPEMADRVAYPTEYAKSKGCTVSPTTGSCRWWTRTSGARKMDMCGMRLDGRISAYGMQDVDWPTNTMRPVMWVQFDE